MPERKGLLLPKSLNFRRWPEVNGNRELEFPEEITALNIQSVCASFVDGLNVAWSLVLSGRYKRVLIVAATAVATKGWGVDQTSPMAKSFGDGAGAAIVSSKDLICEFLSYHNRTFGEMYDLMYMTQLPHEHPELCENLSIKGDKGVYLTVEEEGMAWLTKVGKRSGSFYRVV